MPKVPKFEIPDSVNGNKCINPAALSPFFQVSFVSLFTCLLCINLFLLDVKCKNREHLCFCTCVREIARVYTDQQIKAQKVDHMRQ